MHRSIRVTGLTLSLALSAAIFVWPGAAQAVDVYATGVKQLTAKQFAPAALSFKQAIKANPKNAMAYYYLGLAKHYQGDRQGALESYSKVLSTFPGTDACNLAVRGMASIDPSILEKLGLSSGPAATPAPMQRSQQGSSQQSHGQSSVFGPGDIVPQETRVNFNKEFNCMIVDARINGRSIKMMVDTGAENTVLGENTLQNLNLPVPTTGQTVDIYGSGSTGAQKALVHYVDLSLGGITRKNFPILVKKEFDNYPLIGQSFLRGMRYTVDGSNNTIVLQRADSAPSTASSRSGYDPGDVPFQLEGREMTVMVQVNGRNMPMWFDTGASWITFTRSQAAAAGISVPDDAPVVNTKGAGGQNTQRMVRVQSIKLGPVEKRDFEVGVVDQSAQTRPLLGGAFLSDQQYTIDNDRKVIHFGRR